jgi:hypothetical protein
MIERGRAGREAVKALDAPVHKALTSDSPTYESIERATLAEPRILEKSNFRRPLWKERGIGRGHDRMVRRRSRRGNP